MIQEEWETATSILGATYGYIKITSAKLKSTGSTDSPYKMTFVYRGKDLGKRTGYCCLGFYDAYGNKISSRKFEAKEGLCEVTTEVPAGTKIIKLEKLYED